MTRPGHCSRPPNRSVPSTSIGSERSPAFLEADELGRLALAVLDGGLFAGRRALELAAALLDEDANEADRVRESGG